MFPLLIVGLLLCIFAPSGFSQSYTAPSKRAFAAGHVAAIYTPRPEFPLEARRQKMTGRGIFVLNVDQETGAVLSVDTRQSTGHRILDYAAVDAFKKWRFRPHRTARKVRIPIAFAINGVIGGR